MAWNDVKAEGPDIERVVIDHLTPLVPGLVGATLPATWTPAAGAFTGVAVDGTPADVWPVAVKALVRVTCWDASHGAALRTAWAACNALQSLGRVQLVSTPEKANDPDNRAPLVSFAAYVQLRTSAL